MNLYKLNDEKRKLPAVVDLLSLINHCKPCPAAAAGGGGGFITDAGDVAHVCIADDSQMRLAGEVVQVSDEFLASWKHSARVAGEAPWPLIVIDIRDQRVPVVTQVELHVGFARVTFVNANQLIMTWIALEEAAYPYIHTVFQFN